MNTAGGIQGGRERIYSSNTNIQTIVKHAFPKRIRAYLRVLSVKRTGIIKSDYLGTTCGRLHGRFDSVPIKLGPRRCIAWVRIVCLVRIIAYQCVFTPEPLHSQPNSGMTCQRRINLLDTRVL